MNMKGEKGKNMRNKGITLIALVITIIVLLILAGISIGAITGDNGIINQAQNASDSTERSSWEEQIDIAIIDAESKHRNPTWDDVIEELKNKDIIDDESQVDDKTGAITTNEPSYVIEDKLGDYLPFGPGMIADKNETYEDENGDTATIPGGFEILEDADTVDEGLVIQDEQGNQFVWIPATVDEMANATSGTDSNGNPNYQGKLYNFPTATTSEEKTSYGQGTTSYKEPDTVSNYDNNSDYLNIIKGILTDNAADYADMSTFKTTMQEDYNAMIKSVEKYGGFYIGRYEMSKSDSNTAQSKKNTVALTADNDSSNESQNGNTWYGLYAYGKTYTNTANSVVSSMVWGSQYDAMMRWMQSNGENVTSSTVPNGGTRNTNQTTTGFEGDTDIIRNVYDLYGGRYEWTLESNYIIRRVTRGRLPHRQPLYT